MMQVAMRVVLILILMVGCVAPPLVRPLARGGATSGPEAECLVRQTGVVSLLRLVDVAGNGVKVGDDLVLSARHVIGDGQVAFSVNGAITNVEIVRQGDTAMRDQDWSLVRMDVPDSVPVCPLAVTDSVTRGQDVLVLGFWSESEEEERYPVAVSGTVIDVPASFAQQLGDFVCVSLGGPMNYGGLSGSPVFTKDHGSAEWRLAGVFAATVRSERLDYFNVFARVPKGFEQMLERARH